MSGLSLFQAFSLLRGAKVVGTIRGQFTAVVPSFLDGVSEHDLDTYLLPGWLYGPGTPNFPTDEPYEIFPAGDANRGIAQGFDLTLGVQLVETDYHTGGQILISKLKK